MKKSQLNKSRFIVGLILVVTAVMIFLLTDYSAASVIALGVIGLLSIAISRKK